MHLLFFFFLTVLLGWEQKKIMILICLTVLAIIAATTVAGYLGLWITQFRYLNFSKIFKMLMILNKIVNSMQFLSIFRSQRHHRREHSSWTNAKSQCTSINNIDYKNRRKPLFRYRKKRKESKGHKNYNRVEKRKNFRAGNYVWKHKIQNYNKKKGYIHKYIRLRAETY